MFEKFTLRVFLFSCLLILIPFVSFTAETKTPASVAKPADSGGPKGDLIDINSATKEQLITLPGISEAYAKKIIEGRPYQTKLELTQKQIIPGTTYKAIIYRITVNQKK